MGNWNINIQGVGCHHNGPTADTDANNMATAFVKALIIAGHNVQHAAFTHGAAEGLLPIGEPAHHASLGRDSRTNVGASMPECIKPGDFIMHRSPGNAPYLTIGQVIEGGRGASFRIRPTMRIFGFGSALEQVRPCDPGLPHEVVPPQECVYLYEKTGP